MRLSARFLPVLYSLIFISAVAAAENQSIYFRHLGVTEGLTNNCISSIVQDSRGTLWIGTNDGLNRFDGGNVRTYKNGDRLSGNLPNNAVTSLFVDKEGILWVGTSEGLSKYLPGEDRFVPIQGISGFVHTITQDSGGRIWSAIGAESVVTCFDNKTGQVDTFNFNYLVGNILNELKKERIRLIHQYWEEIIVFLEKSENNRNR